MNSKKLYRSTDNKMLCGVCAGIADYLSVDPTIIRLLWVIFSLMGGAGALLYLVAAVIIPEEEGGK